MLFLILMGKFALSMLWCIPDSSGQFCFVYVVMYVQYKTVSKEFPRSATRKNQPKDLFSTHHKVNCNRAPQEIMKLWKVQLFFHLQNTVILEGKGTHDNYKIPIKVLNITQNELTLYLFIHSFLVLVGTAPAILSHLSGPAGNVLRACSSRFCSSVVQDLGASEAAPSPSGKGQEKRHLHTLKSVYSTGSNNPQ